jgi:hypothetical protein
MTRPDEREAPGESAPLLGTWGRWYALVAAGLVADIVLLAWVTWSFR